MNKIWEPYNPQWLVELAKEQIAERPNIIEALSKCVLAKTDNPAYTYFENEDKPNQSNSIWQFEENIILLDKKHGEIILDVLDGNQIGGVEFLKYVK